MQKRLTPRRHREANQPYFYTATLALLILRCTFSPCIEGAFETVDIHFNISLYLRGSGGVLVSTNEISLCTCLCVYMLGSIRERCWML